MLTDNVPKYILDLGLFLLYEPITVFTNLVLSIIAFWGFYRIKGYTQVVSNAPVQGWAYFFFLLGISSLLGMYTHGVYTQLGNSTYTSVWIGLNILTSVGILMAEISTLKMLNFNQAWLRYLLITKCTFACVWLLIYSNLVVTKIHIGTGFIGLILLLIFSARKRLFARHIVLGLFITVLAGILQGQRLSIHPLWFNFNDVAHVLFYFSVFFVTKGARSYTNELKQTIQ